MEVWINLMTLWVLSGSRWGPRFLLGLKQVIFLSDYVHEAHDHAVSLVDLEALLRFLNLDMSGTLFGHYM